MNHFLSITDILLEPIIGMEYPRVLWHGAENVPGLWASTGRVRAGMATGYPGWARAAALASTSPGSIRRHRGQAGDGGAGARYQPRSPGPGHTRKNLCVPWCSSRVRVTSVGLFWAGAGQRGEVARLQRSRVILDNYLGSGHWSQGLSNTWRDQTWGEQELTNVCIIQEIHYLKEILLFEFTLSIC